MASRLQDVILRGLAADKPLATDVAPGTLYYSSDTQVTERSDGTTWESYSDAGSAVGAGDVVGPASSVDNSVVTFSGTTGKLVDAGPDGTISGSLAIGSDPALTGALRLTNNQAITWRNGTDDLSLLKAVAETLYVGQPGVSNVFINGYAVVLDSNAFIGIQAPIRLYPATVPGLPAAGDAYIWVQDNVSGKTQLLVQFATGSPIVLATQDAVRTSSIEMVIDGGTSAITTGLKGFLEVPFAATIKAVTLLANETGSIVIDIWKDTYAAFPPVVADSITSAAKPTITTAIKSQDTTLTGWTTSIIAGDVLGFNVDSVTSIKKITLSLKVEI